jgi:hypothetical protein
MQNTRLQIIRSWQNIRSVYWVMQKKNRGSYLVEVGPLSFLNV